MGETTSNNIRAFCQKIAPVVVSNEDEQSFRLDLAMERLEVRPCLGVYDAGVPRIKLGTWVDVLDGVPPC
jgi:hypothetical protein